MNFRELLEAHSNVAKAIAGLMFFICLCVIGREIFGGPHPRSASQMHQAFYSDDDGKTWFVDDVSKMPPFDHHGKPAYRALVFRCQGGLPFVAYLAKYSDAQKAQMDADVASDPRSAVHYMAMPMHDIKKPGDADWSANTHPSPTGYPPVSCPDGGANPVQVVPGDRNSLPH